MHRLRRSSTRTDLALAAVVTCGAGALAGCGYALQPARSPATSHPAPATSHPGPATSHTGPPEVRPLTAPHLPPMPSPARLERPVS